MSHKLKEGSNRKDVSQVLEPVKKLIPEDNSDQFLDRVLSAVEIYLDLDEPSVVTKELKEIDRICQNPNYTLLNVLGNVSQPTRDLLEGSTLLGGARPLPPLPGADDEAGLTALAKEIHQRIIVHMKPLSDRKGYRLKGPSQEGRPPKKRLNVLVSFIAFAYVNSTGQSYRRKWDIDAENDLPFHQILEVIFESLGIEASVDEAISRQKKSLSP